MNTVAGLPLASARVSASSVRRRNCAPHTRALLVPTSRMNIVRRLAILALAALLSIVPSLPVAAQTDAEVVGQLSDSAQQILVAINQHRVNAGLNALVVDPLLNHAAQHHANDMLANFNYSHRGSDGSTVKMRVARTGYAADPWVSENWVSSRSVDGAMRWWMNDYIHRVNILTRHWREIGIGIAVRPNTGEMIFVTVFATGRGDGSLQPSVAPAAQPAPAPAPLPTVDVPPGGMDYTIRGGDTLLGIAIRHRLDWRVVAAANGLTEHSILQIGQVIRLPGLENTAGLQLDGDDTTGVTAGTQGTDNGFSQESAPAAPTEPYTVQSGDTLFSIAARRGITWQELARINNLREHDILQIGQTIQAPIRQNGGNGANGGEQGGETGQPPALSTAEAAPPAAVELSNVDPVTINGATNYVIRDYTPLVLAAPQQVAAAGPEVVAASIVQSASVDIEAIPVVEPASEQTAAPAMPAVHVVQAGDTIISIALRHGIDWRTLLAHNGLTEQSVLQLGQEIRLP